MSSLFRGRTFAPVSQSGRGEGLKILQVPVRIRPGAPHFVLKVPKMGQCNEYN